MLGFSLRRPYNLLNTLPITALKSSFLKPVYRLYLFTGLFAYSCKNKHSFIKRRLKGRRYVLILIQHFEVKTLQTLWSLKIHIKMKTLYVVLIQTIKFFMIG